MAIEKLELHTPDFTDENVQRIAELFPNCLTEGVDEAGRTRRMIDFDLLKQELSADIVDGPAERYHLNWPGKRAALRETNRPINKTLRPVRDESVDFDTTRNLFIEGDNLDALKLLQETYLGKVKMIFIDPPYNTGRDFIYRDNFSSDKGEHLQASGQVDEQGGKLVANPDSNGRFHSDWLSMMYPRLKLARNLLREDGVIFIAIDDNEQASLKKICDEIFGEENFVATIIWQKVYAPKNSAKWFSEDHDFILVVAKNKSVWQPNPLPRTEDMEARYKNYDEDPRGPWKAENMTARNPYDAGIYSIQTPSGRTIDGPPTGTYWRISESRFLELDADNRIWWGKDGDNTPAVKKFLSEVSSGRTPQTLWFYDEVGHTQDAKKTLLKYVPFQHTENVLNSVKPVELIQRCIELSTSAAEPAIILDFFSGSASTAHSVIKQNSQDNGKRSFIGVQIEEALPKPETSMKSIFDMGRQRIQNVAAELKSEEFTGDVGFRVLKIDSSNMADVRRAAKDTTQNDLLSLVDNIKPDRTAEDQLFQVLLNWGVDLTLPVEREVVAGKAVYFVAEDALAACFDRAIDEALVKEIAARAPLRAVFRDDAFKDDSARINVEQLFKQLSPATELRVI